MSEQDALAETALVVDDDPRMRILFRTALERDGFHVLEAEDGEQALDIAHQQQVSVVILDVLMPGLNGLDVLRMLRERGDDVPVILATGNDAVQTAVDGMKLGAIEYLQKPVSLTKLAAIAHDAIRKCNALASLESHAVHGYVAGYRICRILGEGETATVYEVERDEKRYALKLMRTSGLSQERKDLMAARFENETKALLDIEHPNIVRVYDTGLESFQPYVVMELLQGQSLADLCYGKERPDFDSRVQIILQVAAALQCIQTQGLSHRDAKPENIMILPGNHAVLMDFGLVAIPDSNLTKSTSIMGTPCYMAPESFQSAIIDPRADIFSLGVVAYELMLRRRPFDADSVMQTAVQVCTVDPIPAAILDPNFPKDLAAIIDAMMIKIPEERYQTAQAVREDLQAFLDGKPLRHAPALLANRSEGKLNPGLLCPGSDHDFSRVSNDASTIIS